MARPAVLIDTVPPATPDVLPRMDVAAFVGLADAGPVDVPVAVEDIAQFRDIFGAEPTLAFDAESGDPQLGYLHASVESFLASGGRRCWVVRAADNPDTRAYQLEGLAELTDTHAALGNGSIAATARSPGIAGAGSIAHTTLIESPLIPARGTTAALSADLDAAPSILRLRLNPVSVPITPGTLLRLQLPTSDLRLFLVAEKVETAAGSTNVSARDWSLARVSTGSPPPDPVLNSERLEIVAPALLDLTPGSPWFGAALRVDALSFELSVWQDEALHSRISGLEFSPRHPRFFRNLPDDDALYFGDRTRRADRRDAELLALWDEARGNRQSSASQTSRRFAIGFAAEPGTPSRSWPIYLPSGMSRRGRPQFDGHRPAEPPLRSGNEELKAHMFIDPRLRDSGGEALRRTAETLHSAARDHARSRRGPAVGRLQGVHALLPVDEVTMIAVPDLSHRRWSNSPRTVDTLLDAPGLLSAAISSGGSELLVEWTAVAEASSYVVQVSTAADFADIAAEHHIDAADTSFNTVPTHLARPKTCGGLLYARVGARRRGEPSPWSNARFVVDGTGAFERCAHLAVERLLNVPPVPPGSFLMQWSSEEPIAPGVTFEVQSAGDALFTGATVSVLTAASQLELPRTGEATRYVRVRPVNGAAAGPWSNTLVWTPPSLSRPILDPNPRASTATAAGSGYDESLLLEVHRGLLRFCHARGDLVGLLSLPRHYGPLDVSDYLAAMIPASESPGFTLARGRRPLTLGETDVLSYGTLFYPWLAHHVDVERGVRRPRFSPCDGIAAGALAQVALERGAWIAAANRPLAGVLALDPRLSDADIDSLHDRQVNVLIKAPAGFLFVDTETLSRDNDTRSLSVRRLLILLKRLAYREGVGLVFEPNDADLQERVQTDFERVLSTLHQLGAFKGTNADEAFKVVADASLNSEASVDAGRFIVELRIAPSEPLKFLRVRLTQNGPQSLSVGEP